MSLVVNENGFSDCITQKAEANGNPGAFLRPSSRHMFLRPRGPRVGGPPDTGSARTRPQAEADSASE